MLKGVKQSKKYVESKGSVSVIVRHKKGKSSSARRNMSFRTSPVTCGNRFHMLDQLDDDKKFSDFSQSNGIIKPLGLIKNRNSTWT